MAYVFKGIPAGRKPKPFMSYVEKTDGCWIWKGARHQKNGYGSFRHNGKVRKAHHVAFEMHNGPLPTLGNGSLDTVVMHTCDNSMCVNPHHLILGTRRQNTIDAMRRSGGVQWSQSRPMRHRFSREEARALRDEGVSYSEIARRFGVDPSSVSAALKRQAHA